VGEKGAERLHASVAIEDKAAMHQAIRDSPSWAIFMHLVNSLDAEGRYYVLNAMTNQLRYPNSSTHYFCTVLLLMFADASNEFLREQITRVLLERINTLRPHPWGLLVTFFELIKNPEYRFWDCEFTRIAPEIKKLLESLHRRCAGLGASTPGETQLPNTATGNPPAAPAPAPAAPSVAVPSTQSAPAATGGQTYPQNRATNRKH
jgi:hypothetical protein